MPRARACHTLSRIRRKLYMFGGYDGSHCFNDIEVYDIDTKIWTTIAVQGVIPDVRRVPLRCSLRMQHCRVGTLIRSL